MTLPVVFTANGPSGYNLTKSLRFRSSASAYLSRTPASAGNRNVWTVSFWFKRGKLSSSQSYYSAGTGGNIDSITLSSSDKISIDLNNTTILLTSQVFRDPSAWYHLVFAVDTSQATASNRAKLYINGSLVTAFDTDNRSSITNNMPITNTTVLHKYGYYDAGILYSDVYFSEINGIDGQQLTASSFGSTNATTGVWQPAKYTGTYGTDGYYLPFTNTTSTTTLGYDFSGNGNNWTTNNISLTSGSTYDSMTDVPTLTSATVANYAVLNPLVASPNDTLSNGNLTWSGSNTSNNGTIGTMAIQSGTKAYWEITCTTLGNAQLGVTASLNLSPSSMASTSVISDATTAYVYSANGVASPSGTAATSYASGDVLGFACDYTGSYPITTIYKNGISVGTCYSTTVPTGAVFPYLNMWNTSTLNTNFGQQSFKYTPPSGYVALNTYNLPSSTIVKGNTVMDATLYVGNNASQTITNAGSFKPDFVWTKARANAYSSNLYDSVRGINQNLQSNSTGAEFYNANSLTSFNSNGFTVGANDNGNASSSSVAWQWQAGQGTTSSNTNGSITSTVSVNANAGFSVVTFTGTGSNATVGHGLGVAPSMIITKQRNTTGQWNVYHSALGNTNVIYLNLSNTVNTDPLYWNSTSPTSSVFSIGTAGSVNTNGTTYVAYCWTPIAGFSAFGSYVANGSTDGPFVYCGFRPRFILVKDTASTSGNWNILDTARDPYNVATQRLMPNQSQAETNGFNVDVLSNGFKVRSSVSDWGVANGDTVIYAAFAENPFKNALAR